MGTGCGTIVGTIFSFGFQHYAEKASESCQIMFVVREAVTISDDISVLLFLLDNPMKSRLTKEEKSFCHRALEEQ